MGQGDPGAQTVRVSNGSGCGAGSWSATSDASWLSATPASGSIGAAGQASISVAAATASLKAGNYIGHLTLSAGQSTATVSVTLKLVVPPPPAGCLQVVSPNPPAVDVSSGVQQVIVANNCGGTVTVSANRPWIQVTQTDTAGNRLFYDVQAAPTPSVSSDGVLTFTATTAGGSQSVQVNVHITISVRG